MTQLNESNLRLFARAIMPDLYRMQERYDRRKEPAGGSYHLANQEDYDTLMKLLTKKPDSAEQQMHS